jgi:hypothetical protein
MNIRNLTCVALASAIALGMSACTTTQKVSVMQPGDTALNCSGLRAEFAKLDAIQADADSDKGVNGANVAAVLLFWPAAAGNYLNARDAQQLVTQRRTYLMGLHNEKQCDNPANASLTFRVPMSMLTPERSETSLGR